MLNGTECTLKRFMPTAQDRKQNEIGIYWLVSKSVRRNLDKPENMDVKITGLIKNMPSMSDWLRRKLEYLRAVNRKRLR